MHKVNAISRAVIYPRLVNATADRLSVARISQRRAVKTNGNSRPCANILAIQEPSIEGG